MQRCSESGATLETFCRLLGIFEFISTRPTRIYCSHLKRGLEDSAFDRPSMLTGTFKSSVVPRLPHPILTKPTRHLATAIKVMLKQPQGIQNRSSMSRAPRYCFSG